MVEYGHENQEGYKYIMGRYTGPKEKIERRLGVKLFLKGERSHGPKAAMVRRPYPPGPHGQKRARKKSEYGLHIFMPGIPYYNNFEKDQHFSYRLYYKSLHKESIGYLYNLNKFNIDGIGGSLSTHGYYSSFIDSNKMGSLYLTGLKSRVGISGYFGDYQGIDFDFKVLDYNFLKSYLCIRNIKIWDVELNIKPFNFDLIFNLEKWDDDYVYGFEYTIFKEKGMRLIINIDNKKSGFMIDLNNVLFDVNYSYREVSLVDFNIKVGI